jgi:hypothetical protein
MPPNAALHTRNNGVQSGTGSIISAPVFAKPQTPNDSAHYTARTPLSPDRPVRRGPLRWTPDGLLLLASGV